MQRPEPSAVPTTIQAMVPRAEVARRLGLSVREVGRIERRALLKCRDALQSRGLSYRALLDLISTPNQENE